MTTGTSRKRDRASRPSSGWPAARRATALLFLADGIGFGTWAALLPSLQARLALSDAQLGGAMLGMVAGAMVAMLFIGRILARQGSAATLAVVAPLFAVALAGPVVAPNQAILLLAAAAFGACKGAFDVSVNAQAVAVEQSMGRPIMSTFQALWSLGGLGAALAIGLALKAGTPPLLVTAVVAGALLALVPTLPRWLVADAGDDPAAATRGRPPLARVWPLGLLAFVALFVEGVMMDWSAVFARNVAGAAAWLAPVAYGVFCSAMAAGRLAGDRLVARFSAPRVLTASGILTVAGILVVVMVPSWPVTFAGLLVAGLGLANLVPIFLTAAGAIQPGAAGRAVAAVSTIGYAGFLAGPPLIGGLSGPIGLRGAFLFAGLLATSIALAGPRLLGRRGSSSPRAAHATEFGAPLQQPTAPL